MIIISLTLYALNQSLGAAVCLHGSCLAWIKINVKFAPVRNDFKSVIVQYSSMETNTDRNLIFQVNIFRKFVQLIQPITLRWKGVLQCSSHTYFWIFAEVAKLQQWKKTHTSDSLLLPLRAVAVTALVTAPEGAGGQQDHQGRASCHTSLRIATGLFAGIIVAKHITSFSGFGPRACLAHNRNSFWSTNMKIPSTLVLLSSNVVLYSSCCLLIHAMNMRWLCNFFVV